MIPTIDFDKIAADMEMDPEDIVHLMTLYSKELAKDLSALETDIAQNNWLHVKNKLHKMKGDAANLLLDDLAVVLAKMETASQQTDIRLLEKQLEQVSQLQACFAADFRKYAEEKR